MGNNLRTCMWTFHNGTQEASNGNTLIVNVGMMIATFEVTGSGTNKVIFEGKSSNDAIFYPIIGVNLNDLSMATETALKNTIYQVSLEGLVAFRVRVNEYTDGSVTVKGTVVN